MLAWEFSILSRFIEFIIPSDLADKKSARLVTGFNPVVNPAFAFSHREKCLNLYMPDLLQG